jgi:L-threonate 2-dehydrogenase
MSNGAEQSTGPGAAAVIGLGAMGLGIALFLRCRGFEVTGCDVRQVGAAHLRPRRPLPVPRSWSRSWSMQPRPKPRCLGSKEPQPQCSRRAVFVSSATMDPDLARRLANRLEAMGRLYLDAPISGGALRAGEGTLTVIASGSPAAHAQARPAFRAIAAKIYELGDEPGQAAAFKMINQLLAGVHIAAAREAITFAAKQDSILTRSTRSSPPRPAIRGCSRTASHTGSQAAYAPRSAVNIFVKDLGIVQDMAYVAKFPVPLAAAALQIFLMAAGSDMGGVDDASLARVYARVTGVSLPGAPAS